MVPSGRVRLTTTNAAVSYALCPASGLARCVLTTAPKSKERSVAATLVRPAP